MVPTWAENRSNMAENCDLSRYLICVKTLKRFWCQLGPNMGPSWVAKSLQNSLQTQLGHQKAANRTPEASGSQFWTLRGTIGDPPGVDLKPPGNCFFRFSGVRFSTLRMTILFHAFPCRHRLTACLLTWLPAAAATMASQVLWVGGCPR